MLTVENKNKIIIFFNCIVNKNSIKALCDEKNEILFLMKRKKKKVKLDSY